MLLVCSAVGRAQGGLPPTSLPSSGEHRANWGTGSNIWYHVGPSDFSPLASSSAYNPDALFVGRFGAVAEGKYVAPVHIPSGAFLTLLEFDYCDVDVNDDADLTLYDCNYLGADCVNLGAISTSSRPTGCGSLTDVLSISTVNNNSRQLILVCTLRDAATEVLGAYIGYRLQIAEAPGTATFADVPTTHTYFRAIEALASSGITGGCGNGNFCPNKNVSRGEMAAFLARALGLHFAN